MEKQTTIKATNEKEFLNVQAKLERSGYRLEDYDEYFGTETWSRGNRAVTIKLEEDSCKQFLAGYDSDYSCKRIECDSINAAKAIILQAYAELFAAGLASEFSGYICKRVSDDPFDEDNFDDTWQTIIETNIASYASEKLEFITEEE